jgi:hypothetical protein
LKVVEESWRLLEVVGGYVGRKRVGDDEREAATTRLK